MKAFIPTRNSAAAGIFPRVLRTNCISFGIRKVTNKIMTAEPASTKNPG